MPIKSAGVELFDALHQYFHHKYFIRISFVIFKMFGMYSIENSLWHMVSEIMHVFYTICDSDVQICLKLNGNVRGKGERESQGVQNRKAACFPPNCLFWSFIVCMREARTIGSISFILLFDVEQCIKYVKNAFEMSKYYAQLQIYRFEHEIQCLLTSILFDV